MLLHHPTLQVSTLTDAAAKAAEDKQFEKQRTNSLKLNSRLSMMDI
jgi:hypothetical protein